MRQPVTIHPSFYQSPSVFALPETYRMLVPHDWACSEPDSYGCFTFSPQVIWIHQRGIQPSQQLADVEHRLALYRVGDEPLLEVWSEAGRSYGHWVAWFKPVLGTRNKRLLNAYDPSKMGARRTPIPPSLRPWNGDPRLVEDWRTVIQNAAETNREAPSLKPGSTLPIPFLLPGSTFPEIGKDLPWNREASSSASATATAPSDARAREDGGGGSSPGGENQPVPRETNNQQPLETIDEPVSRDVAGATRRAPTLTRAELLDRMRAEWQRVSGLSNGLGFTDQDLSRAVEQLRGQMVSAAEILEAWGWFLRHGPDGAARRNLQAATPVNFARFGWQAWVAHRTAGPPSHQPAPQVIPEGPPDFQFPPGAKGALQSLYGRNEPEEIIQ